MGRGGRRIIRKLLHKIRRHMKEEEATEMESDGGVDLDELKTILTKAGIKPSPMSIEIFHELDTNKNGLLEKSEVKSEGEGEDYGLFTSLLSAVVMGFLQSAVRRAVSNALGG